MSPDAERTRRILVVDDEDVVLSSVAKVVQPFGEVCLARSAREATDKLGAGERWDALVLDVVLRDGSGLDVLRGHRAEHPGTPVVVMSAYLEPEYANAAFALAAYYLVKPFAPRLVADFLRRAFGAGDRQEVRRSPPAAKLRTAIESLRRKHRLSEAEADILARTASGETRPQIAAARRSTEATVQRHVSNLLRRTQHDSLHAAAEEALREALSLETVS